VTASEATTKNQARHGEGHFETPEALPNRKLETPRGLIQIARHRRQRLVEAEGHVPGLTREDREDRGKFRPDHAPREQIEEKENGKGKKTKNRHRLQDIERGNQNHPKTPALGGKGCHNERKDDRKSQRHEHAERRSEGVVGQVSQVEMDRVRRRQRREGAARRMGDEDEAGQHAQDRGAVPNIGNATTAHEGGQGRCRHGLRLSLLTD
jgi:hypothetical protein